MERIRKRIEKWIVIKQIQRMERNLHQLCHVASKIIFAAGGEPSSEHYFMD